jgi:general secretion pathway protein D
MRKTTWIVALLAGLALTSCTVHSSKSRAAEAARGENWDAAVYYYLDALAQDPTNLRVKVELQRVRVKASLVHFNRGRAFKEAGELRRAQSELELAVQLDPTNQYAAAELSKVQKDIAVLDQEGGTAKLAAMKKAASEMKVKPPALNPASDEPISLSFPTERNVKEIYKAIGQAFGINILYDPKLKDTRIAVELKNVTARQALESVMQAAGHFYKVIDEKTVIVVEDTPQNRRDYEDLVVKTFFLSNSEVKDVSNMLRSLIDARRLATNEQLNSIVIRDTADKVAIAERLINANDKSKAEVLIDIELIQIDSNRVHNIGMALSSYTFPITLDESQITGANATTGRIPLNQLNQVTRSMWGVVLPDVTISLIKSSGDAQTLAQPQLRITEGEKGSLLIGDKVPLPTTSFNTSQTIGGNIVPVTAYQYQDVGIKIELQPRVHHNNEITMKLRVEFSDLGDQVTVGPNQTAPKISTRTIETIIRLKEGETSMMAGLLKTNVQSSQAGIPWLMDLPVLGPLFRSNSKTTTQTDLVLTLTPHIIRNPDITEEDLAAMWVGTETKVTIFGNSPRVRSPNTASPFGDIRLGIAGDVVTGAPEAAPEAPAEAGASQGRSVVARPTPNPVPVQLVPPPKPQAELNTGSGTETVAAAQSSGVQGTVAESPTTAATIQSAAVQSGAAGQSSGTQGVAAQSTSAEGGAVALGAALTSGAAAAADATYGLPVLSFEPQRVPVAVGGFATIAVILDAGSVGVASPLHLAFDPARLEVSDITTADVTVVSGRAHVQANNAAALGLVTLTWPGTAIVGGTLAQLKVKPRATGEIQLFFAGPAGAVISRPATIVAVPSLAAGATR